MGNLLLFVIPLVLAIAGVKFIQLIKSNRKYDSAKLPPGPPGRDHANLLDNDRWNMFKSWNEQYGNVVTFYTGQQLNIVLGTMEAAVDILEKAGETFSSRPHFIMGEFLFSRLRGFSMTYGPKWRNWRTLQNSHFSPQVAPKVKPMQINESAILMHDYLTNEDPSKQHKILRRYTASLMFYMGYGRRVTSLDDPLCVAHDQEEEYIERVPGRFPLESWPILLWLPRPLQWFRHEPEKHRDTNTKLYTTAMNEVKRKMQDGTAVPCTSTYGLTKQKELDMNDDVELAYALSAPWAAGIGTTTTAFEIAILAMLHYPECLQKAKAEIDAVVGKDRMPTFEDQQSLPYLGAFIRETLRWRLVTPTGIAHSSTQDYTYKGMLIPKDASVYANAAEIMKDPAVFPEGEKFIPERFLETNDPRLLNYRFGCFGFGRRMCPGMHVALQSMYIVIARLIWAYNVLPVTINGKPYIPDENDFTYGLVSYPANLKFQLVPRSERHREIIIADAERANADMAHLEGSSASYDI
ncbi:uncharacterized protein EAE97_000671 [Botrytis byssoidea]|uniref:Cytochrome P450 n=1 Tax=Botrytis byssoidea TaxID=139641 RepID=A0A9P5IVU2_9HELO|nr:uncharacterized protein EAE97_000671 [Botrytis byssoidea]KAF7955412.1 hypothetical protein EAE97_000671 [Botrytis byssoidea]